MAVVGPGAAQQIDTDVQPLLNGASEYEYVTLLNPLTDDFAIRVAQDIPVNMPFQIGKDTSGKVETLTNSESDAKQIYGLSLKNKDFKGRKHITNDTIIPAGQTINLRGNDAQVAIRQLTNEILQREGKTRLMADPSLRNEVENRIIIARGSIEDILAGRNLQTVNSQIDQALKESNEVPDEQPFGGLTQTPAAGNGSRTASEPQERRSPGRPKKA